MTEIKELEHTTVEAQLAMKHALRFIKYIQDEYPEIYQEALDETEE